MRHEVNKNIYSSGRGARYDRLATTTNQSKIGRVYRDLYPEEMSDLYCQLLKCKTIKGRELVLQKMHNLMHEKMALPVEQKGSVELAESIFDYFRYTYDSEGGRWSFFEDYGLGIRELIESSAARQRINEERYMALLTAFTQQGKTFVMIALSAIHLALGENVLIVVKSVSDADQLIPRINTVFMRLCSFLKEKGRFTDANLAMFQTPYCYLDSRQNSVEKKTFEQELHKALTGVNPHIIIAIHHEQHLDRIIKHHVILGRVAKIALMVDEAHELGAYKYMSKTGLGDDMYNPLCAFDIAMDRLKDPVNTTRVYLITATPQDIYYCEPRLWGRSCCRIPHRKGYVGISEMQFEIVEPGNRLRGDSVDGRNIYMYEGWLSIVAELSRESPVERVNKFGIEDTHPIILISMVERENERQHLILEACKRGTIPVNENHRQIIDANWTVICKNQTGTRIFHESLRGQTVTIGKQACHDYLNTGEFVLKATVEEVLQWLFMNGGVNQFGHIMIVAYNKAQASTTFCSAVTGNIETDANWHPTHVELINIGKTCSTSKLEQRVGRGTGNNKDRLRNGSIFHTKLYCSAATKKKLLLGVALNVSTTQAIVERCAEGDFKVMEFVRAREMYSSHIPNNPFSIPNLKTTISKKKGRNPNAIVEKHAIRYGRYGASALCVLQPSLQKVYKWKPDAMKRIRAQFEMEARGQSEEKKTDNIASDGLVYTIDPESLTDSKARLVSEVIDQIADSDVWVARAAIINRLVQLKGYTANTIRADLTRIQQSVIGRPMIGSGLNFRKISGKEEIEVLYHA
jgi:hypothetical protein